MRKFKNLLILALAVVMAFGLFTGCESMEDKIAALSGTWSMTVADSEEQAQSLLENIDLYEEEIALIDLTSLEYVRQVTFDTEKNYSFAYNADSTKECVRAFYVSAFDALYENRASLNSVYEVEFDAMTEEEFQQFYAELYAIADFAALIDEFTENAYDYEALAEAWETGTYTIKGDDIMCTITGETQAESLGYSIDGDVLTLTFSDAVQVYYKN